MTPIIGIAGKARSGKDSAANMVLALRGGYRYGFADPIKAMTDAIPGLEKAHILEAQNRKEEVIPELNRTYRFLWQTLGTEWGRNTVCPNIWLVCAGWQLAMMGDGMVISDVRFENEADWIRGKGGRIIHMKRDQADGKVGVAGHASEAGIAVKYSDVTIENSASLDDLNTMVRFALTRFGDFDGDAPTGRSG